MTVQDEDLRALLGIDPERLQTALDVIAELDELPVDHPDAVAVRLATGRLFKQVKERRRRERRLCTMNSRNRYRRCASGRWI